MRGARLLAFIAVLAAFGCSTAPRNSGRQGMFDRWGESEGRASRSASSSIGNREIAHIRAVARDWKWPLKNVVVTSPFGQRGRRFHEGVDFRAYVGTPVLAVAGGSVLYAGSRVKGYGRMVVLQHDGDLLTVYAHHSRNLVRAGQRVKAGQKIALSGRSGRASGPHLHFEVRRRESPVDPLQIFQDAKIAVFEEPAIEYEEEASHVHGGEGLGAEISKMALGPAMFGPEPPSR